MTMTQTAPAETPVVKVGDFFSSSWGYDQTNVDFYKVVGLTKSGKSVRVVKVGSRVDHSDMHDYVVPSDEPTTGAWVRNPGGWSEYDPSASAPVETHRLRVGGYKGASFTVNSYSSAYLWDGTPQYKTGYGLGH